MVPEASAGETHSELGALLRVPVQRPLRDLLRAQAPGRRVVEGVGEFVHELRYLSPSLEVKGVGC